MYDQHAAKKERLTRSEDDQCKSSWPGTTQNTESQNDWRNKMACTSFGRLNFSLKSEKCTTGLTCILIVKRRWRMWKTTQRLQKKQCRYACEE